MLYLQVKAIEQLEELRDSSQVQALMGQQKPVQHHIHVVLWDTQWNKKKKHKVSDLEGKSDYPASKAGIYTLGTTTNTGNEGFKVNLTSVAGHPPGLSICWATLLM